MAGDGSIVIDTELDTGGLEDGLDRLKKLINEGVKDAGGSLGSMFDGLDEAVGKASLVNGIEKLIDGAKNALLGGAAELGSAAGAAASGAASGISEGEGSFRSGGERLISAATVGIEAGAGAMAAAGSQAALSTAGSMNIPGQFMSVGGNLISALRAGLAAGAAALYAKASEIAAGVVSRMKGMFKIHSPSAVFRDEIGKMLMLGLRDGILNNSEAVLAATEDLAGDMLESERRYLEEKERIDRLNDQEDEARRVREYEKRLSQAKTQQEKDELIEEERLRLRKRADSKYLEQLEDAAEKERDIIEGLKDDIKATYEEIAEYVENSLEPIEDSRRELEEKLKDYAEENSAGLYRTVVKGFGEKEGEDLTLFSLADQQRTIDMLTRYSAALQAAADRIEGVFDPETARSFMSVLTDMDVEEGTVFAETLTAASDGDFKKYIEDWGKKNTLAEEISRQLYGEAFTEAVDDCTEYMRSRLEKLGLEVPEGFFASGSLSAKEFGKGFTEGINQVLEEANELIRSFGGFSAETAAGGVSSVVNNNNYYSTYSVNGTRSTAAESIFALEAAAAMNKFRGLS